MTSFVNRLTISPLLFFFISMQFSFHWFNWLVAFNIAFAWDIVIISSQYLSFLSVSPFLDSLIMLISFLYTSDIPSVVKLSLSRSFQHSNAPYPMGCLIMSLLPVRFHTYIQYTSSPCIHGTEIWPMYHHPEECMLLQNQPSNRWISFGPSCHPHEISQQHLTWRTCCVVPHTSCRIPGMMKMISIHCMAHIVLWNTARSYILPPQKNLETSIIGRLLMVIVYLRQIQIGRSG